MFFRNLYQRISRLEKELDKIEILNDKIEGLKKCLQDSHYYITQDISIKEGYFFKYVPGKQCKYCNKTVALKEVDNANVS